MTRRAWIAVAALSFGCAGDAARNDLGMARFEVREAPGVTTAIGWDADGREVGRLEIVEGRFTMSEFFAGERDDPRVEGRRLEVRALDQTLRWETEGFAPARSLPAHPASQWAIAAFLADPGVERLLESRGIAFKKAEKEGHHCDLEGTHPVACSGQTTCQTLFGGMEPVLAPPGTCGRAVAATVAWTVHQRAFAGYHWDQDDASEVEHDQSFIAQCCPQAETQPAFYAKKSCPDSRSCTAATPCQTTCGEVTVPGKCVACPSYPSDGVCDMRVEKAGWKDKDAPGGKERVYQVCARFGSGD